MVMLLSLPLWVECLSALSRNPMQYCSEATLCFMSFISQRVLLSLVWNLSVRTRVLLSLVSTSFRRLESLSDGRSLSQAHPASYLRGRRSFVKMGRMDDTANRRAHSLARSKAFPHCLDGGSFVWPGACHLGSIVHCLERGAAQRRRQCRVL